MTSSKANKEWYVIVNPRTANRQTRRRFGTIARAEDAFKWNPYLKNKGRAQFEIWPYDKFLLLGRNV